MPTIFEEAQDIIYGDREQTYGHPEYNLESIAEFWRVYVKRKFGTEITFDYHDVAYMMVLLKLARLVNTPNHEDSQRDGIGYFGLPNRIQREQEALRNTPLHSATNSGD